MSNNNQAGKGDKPRPVVKKTFDANYDQIVWAKLTKTGSKTTKPNKTTYKY
jgi:hypothetical protein